MQTIDVLVGGNALYHRQLRQLGRQGQLHEDAVDARIGIEPVDKREHGGGAAVGRECIFLGAYPDFVAGLDLVAHINLRRGIVADQHRRESGRHAERVEPVGARLP